MASSTKMFAALLQASALLAAGTAAAAPAAPENFLGAWFPVIKIVATPDRTEHMASVMRTMGTAGYEFAPVSTPPPRSRTSDPPALVPRSIRPMSRGTPRTTCARSAAVNGAETNPSIKISR